MPWNHAQTSGLDPARADEQPVWRRVQFAVGDEYSRRQGVYLQPTQRRNAIASTRLFLGFGGRAQRSCRRVPDRDFLRTRQAAVVAGSRRGVGGCEELPFRRVFNGIGDAGGAAVAILDVGIERTARGLS